MKLGSLFDGSGGFPLGGIIAGMTPVWSSEIEPFPIRVTEKRLPSAGYMPGGYAAVTRRQVAFFLMQLFGVDESSITRWRVKGDIPPPKKTF